MTFNANLNPKFRLPPLVPPFSVLDKPAPLNEFQKPICQMKQAFALGRIEKAAEIAFSIANRDLSDEWLARCAAAYIQRGELIDAKKFMERTRFSLKRDHVISYWVKTYIEHLIQRSDSSTVFAQFPRLVNLYTFSVDVKDVFHFTSTWIDQDDGSLIGEELAKTLHYSTRLFFERPCDSFVYEKNYEPCFQADA